ncbi:hypothetical protein L596_018732 [Steinernema carpocapsae]|uniref:Uncharacterized protein n=1 Tax=Steinernema carpocapsae TaxID=34508 RepID=A0A4U5N5I0_STECR|nr:hypothetical protein L596_018732 [Steinernema carpocapsae]
MLIISLFFIFLTPEYQTIILKRLRKTAGRLLVKTKVVTRGLPFCDSLYKVFRKADLSPLFCKDRKTEVNSNKDSVLRII